jgi:hypothetical protein
MILYLNDTLLTNKAAKKNWGFVVVSDEIKKGD